MTVPHILPSQVRNLERRVGKLEDVADAHEATLYALRRDATGLTLDMGSLLAHFGLTRATDADVDNALDGQ